jgi:hypothetical protein
MTRRQIGFLILLVLAHLLAPLAAPAAQPGKIPRIGVLSFYDPPSEADRQRLSFVQGLRELGWIG